MGSRTGSHRGRVDVPEPDTLDFDETGLGDPLIRFDFDLAANGERTFGFYGAAKIPLASDDSGFGNGEWDFGLGLSMLQNVGSGSLLVELGGWSLGDLPDLELKDPVTGTVAYASDDDGRKVGASPDWGLSAGWSATR